MAVQYIGLKEINGPLIALDNVAGVSYDEVAEIQLDDGTVRTGRVVQIEDLRASLWKCLSPKNFSEECSTVQADLLTDLARYMPRNMLTSTASLLTPLPVHIPETTSIQAYPPSTP